MATSKNCHVWVCTSPGHWAEAQRIYVKDSHNVWKLGKALWVNEKGHYIDKCDSLLGYGYILGGNDVLGSNVEHATNAIERIDLSRDLVHKLAVVLANSGEYPCCFSSAKDVFVSDYNWVNKFTFSTETAAKTGNFKNWRYDNVGLTDSKSMGYSLGGRSSGDAARSEIFSYNMINYASAAAGNLPKAVQAATPTYSLTRGFLLGGSPGKGSLARGLNYIQRMIFSNRAVALSGHHLAVAIQASGSAVAKTTGYTAGGYVSTNFTNIILAFIHSNETSVRKSAVLKTAVAKTSGLGAGTHGIFFGGSSVKSGKVLQVSTIIQTYTFATNTSATKNVSLHDARNKAGTGTNRGALL